MKTSTTFTNAFTKYSPIAAGLVALSIATPLSSAEPSEKSQSSANGYHTLDGVTNSAGETQARLIYVAPQRQFTFDGFNQGAKDWYFGDNAIYGNTRVAPLIRLISTQDSFGALVPGVRVSGKHGALEAGYLDHGAHLKLKAWANAMGVDWYLTHITNAKPGDKPFSLTEIEGTKMLGHGLGLVGRATWQNFGGKPNMQCGVKYVF